MIYINDLTAYLNDCKAQLYVDDITIFMSSNSYIDLILGPKIEMELVLEWLKAYILTLNSKKTNVLVFGFKHKLRNNEYMVQQYLEVI